MFTTQHLCVCSYIPHINKMVRLKKIVMTKFFFENSIYFKLL